MKPNPISILSNTYGWSDYSTFRSHLKLPKIYLLNIFKKYRVSLSAVPVDLPSIITEIHNLIWNDMKSEVTIKHKLYKIAGVPTQFLDTVSVPNCAARTLQHYAKIKDNIGKLCGQGHVFYFNSVFQESALLAASEIVKSAVDCKVSCYCMSVVSYLDACKEFEYSEKMKKITESELILLYFIGSEYQTTFSDTQISTLLQRRALEKKTTILVSDLSDTEYKKKYKEEIRGYVLNFTDDKLSKTLSEILKEL